MRVHFGHWLVAHHPSHPHPSQGHLDGKDFDLEAGREAEGGGVDWAHQKYLGVSYSELSNRDAGLPATIGFAILLVVVLTSLELPGEDEIPYLVDLAVGELGLKAQD